MTSSTNAKDYIPVPEFFNGKSIFLTGGTGFLGKVLVEKLLRSCPGIENIYFFVRPKKNKEASERLAATLSTSVFDRLRNERPEVLKKIIPVTGDVSKPYWDICQGDREMLMRKVSIVFHGAATVKFNEPLIEAVKINTLGTRHLIRFCQQMSNLQVFVHISTAYSFCFHGEVNEEIYPLPYESNRVIQIMELMDDHLVESIAPKLTVHWPNTYTFAKALAENVLEKESTNFPIAIVRPSIVLSSLKEPQPGWLDNWNGPSAIVAAGGKGFLHIMLGDGGLISDIIPVDLAVNLTICAAWRSGTVSHAPRINVYNSCTGGQNPITWGTFCEYCTNSLRKNPLEDVLVYPNFFLQRNRNIFNIQTFFLEKMKAYFFDLLSYVTREKAIYVQLYNKLMSASDTLQYFTRNQWKFHDENVQNLNSLLNDEDRKIFFFDVREIDWRSYVEDYCLGIRHFLLRNKPDTLVSCQSRMKMLKGVNVLLPFLFFAVIVYIFLFP